MSAVSSLLLMDRERKTARRWFVNTSDKRQISEFLDTGPTELNPGPLLQSLILGTLRSLLGTLRARSIQPKFRPVRPGKEDHLKRWTCFFETFPVGPNRSIECWTEMSGNFGWMDRALSKSLRRLLLRGRGCRALGRAKNSDYLSLICFRC